MLIVSDVHGAFDALAEVVARGQTLLILGDLINLLDYRTREGIIADVLGEQFGARVAGHRASGDYQAMRDAWGEVAGDRRDEVRAAITRGIEAQYASCQKALTGAVGFCTYGNVDNPELLAAVLPETMRFVDGEVHEIEGMTVGFVGGGISTPLAAAGEVTDEEMSRKLEKLGRVDVLCSHLPPQIDALCTDVITGRKERSSAPILDYVRTFQPRHHFFGDVHQPRALTWRVGKTQCRNVGYFRATRRPVIFEK
ncbi:MAG TPA: metallophosphoesterase [Acidimicrobiia bacterium]|nr:metallophosphoesterase [Acidimicrobiia bacterium]